MTTRGFADIIEIARQHRPSLYDPFVDRPVPLVPRALRFEVDERLDADGLGADARGTARCPRCRTTSKRLPSACCTPTATRSPRRRSPRSCAHAGYDVTVSSELSPEFREYERTVTTVVNAYLRPACAPYLERIAAFADEVLVMTSAGGLVAIADARERPAALLLSGPAGGVRAAAAVAAAAATPTRSRFDMGGTSTDVCLVRGGVPEPAAQRDVGGLPDPAARARHPHDRRRRRIDRAPRPGRRARRRPARARVRRPGRRATGGAGRPRR